MNLDFTIFIPLFKCRWQNKFLNHFDVLILNLVKNILKCSVALHKFKYVMKLMQNYINLILLQNIQKVVRRLKIFKESVAERCQAFCNTRFFSVFIWQLVNFDDDFYNKKMGKRTRWKKSDLNFFFFCIDFLCFWFYKFFKHVASKLFLNILNRIKLRVYL